MDVQNRLQQKLQEAFGPEFLKIENESHMHNVPAGSESHFKVVIVSQQFADQMPVKRHQQVYQVLADDLQHDVHALALHTYTPQEWGVLEKAPESPACGGGH
ncbi:BolA family protein [Sansalvadorimonas verongulae]|uniref:BolA family protein n=1 Tax=Sansalvadorimonas verongulae TaxID=2172824 RepID=UPI0012BD6673|nr:BolA/IbaG family iron-sulfur metabolism protein [Sansalvadorimonas verongulae]MTI12988.1 BolA/IbaG family iron-sulfur metabolism protein [Sansalvadorimonas verongulae]